MDKNNKLFVVDIEVNNKKLNKLEEYQIIENVRDVLLHMILVDGTEEAKQKVSSIIKEVTGGQPMKGNIHYFAENGEKDENCIEIVRAAHGGGNNQSARNGGGVVVATIKTVEIRGELSPIHGLVWYRPEENDPFLF